MTQTTKTMSGAELKVALGGLGLAPGWFADYLDVTMRTVVRWFDGPVVEPRVASAVEKLEELTLAEMKKMVEDVESSLASDPYCEETSPIVLRTYRVDREFKNKRGWPAEWHRSLVFRVREHFESQDYNVTVEYR